MIFYNQASECAIQCEILIIEQDPSFQIKSPIEITTRKKLFRASQHCDMGHSKLFLVNDNVEYFASM